MSSENCVIYRKSEGKIALTNREKEVLQLVAEGLSNTQISSILSILPVTVKRHCENIRSKLNVGTTVEAVISGVIKGEVNVVKVIEERDLDVDAVNNLTEKEERLLHALVAGANPKLSDEFRSNVFATLGVEGERRMPQAVVLFMAAKNNKAKSSR